MKSPESDKKKKINKYINFYNRLHDINETKPNNNISFRYSKQLRKSIPVIVENISILQEDLNCAKNNYETKKTKQSEYEFKRLSVMLEILASERRYHSDIFFLYNKIVNHLHHKKLIPENDYKLIYGEIKSIIQCNSELLAKMEKEAKNSTSILKSFQIFEKFKIYQNYINNYDISNEKNSKLMKNEKYKEFIDNISSELNISVFGLLIKPVQRIPQYLLLLNELKKYTPEDHPTNKDLLFAIESVKNVSKDMEEKMGKNIKRRELIIYASNFNIYDQSNITSNQEREIVRSDILKKKNRKGDWDWRLFTIFNDSILYASCGFTSSVNHFFLFKEGINISKNKNIDNSQNYEIIFESNIKSFIIKFENEISFNEWFDAFNKNYEDFFLSSNVKKIFKTSAPILIDEKNINKCSICHSIFSFFLRKYHCKKCGKVICDKCSKNKIVVEGSYRNYPVRVCSRCYFRINNAWASKLN